VSKRKKVSAINKLNLDLADIEPLTIAQDCFFKSYANGDNHLLLGYPGTGKTFLSLFKAFEETLDKKKCGIVIVRSAVPTRDVGFLPGNLEEKGEIYELPYQQITNELFGRGDAYEILKKHGVIRFLTTSYIRGITLDDVIIIADEFQNMTAHEADSIITRLGKNAKIIYCGDFMQTDLIKNKEMNIHRFISVIESMESWFDVTEFGVDDIVRSGLVKDYIITKYKKYEDGY
jgi:phosphate starvation-inducible protein PhoH